MKFGIFILYLILINIVGFILFGINILLSLCSKRRIDTLLMIVSTLGGSLGILISILLFDRKAKKDNMMSKVFISCVLVIQLILFLITQDRISDNITFSFWEFLSKNKLLLVYLGIINFVTFVVFALDKFNAISNKSRIRITNLLGLCFIGGSLGGLLAMYLFRHKTKQNYFTVGVPLIIVMQVIVLSFLINIK